MEEWLESFRMTKLSFSELCNKLRNELEPKPQYLKPREPLSVEKQIAVALYKLASTAEYRVIGNTMGIHKSTVKKCVYKVVKAINQIMLQNYIYMPHEKEAKFIAQNFEEKCGIPQIIGSIDGTHIKLFHQVKDNIVAKHPGSYHDAAVLKDSTLYKNSNTIIPKETQNINGMEIPFMIVGDPAYPLLPWLLKGYSGSLSAEQESFNVYLNSARVSVEMAFDRLKARWRILHQINCDYIFAPEIIVACCILHNFVESKQERFYSEWLQEAEQLQLLTPQPTCATNYQRDSVQAVIANLNVANIYCRESLDTVTGDKSQQGS
ncbi:protein ALP1-like [Nylanderia fulva]|uniref:protein ALP1-like n=1 Tax=Nylanderia fulva TaxID=613905 RepID=UPI0010FB252B|nr:protein ALP1-like [Nylanderia fulva]